MCESRGGRPGLSVLMSLTVSVDVKQYWTMLTHWSQLVPNNYVNRHPKTLSNTTAAVGFMQSPGAVWKSRWPSWVSVLKSLVVSVDVKQHWTVLISTGHKFVPNMSTDIRGHEALLHHLEFMYPVFTRMPGESHRRRFRFLLLSLFVWRVSNSN